MSGSAAAVDAGELTAFRDGVRRFVDREIAPYVHAWDEAETFPRELYAQAADAGLIGIGYPEHLGGTPAPMRLRMIATEEIARAGSGGLMASLFSHSIALPPIVAHGSDTLQRRIVPDVLAGRKIAALAITEPGGGSDVARLACRAAATATSGSSTARRPSSPPASAPTGSRSPCVPAPRARPASRSSPCRATRPG